MLFDIAAVHKIGGTAATLAGAALAATVSRGAEELGEASGEGLAIGEGFAVGEAGCDAGAVLGPAGERLAVAAPDSETTTAGALAFADVFFAFGCAVAPITTNKTSSAEKPVTTLCRSSQLKAPPC